MIGFKTQENIQKVYNFNTLFKICKLSNLKNFRKKKQKYFQKIRKTLAYLEKL